MNFSIKKILIARWSEIRTKGRLRFIVTYGALGWGVSVTIICSIIMLIFSKTISIPMFIFISVIVFPLLGTLWAMDMWNQCERAAKLF